MKSSPEISFAVAIPVYNEAGYVKDVIRRVKAYSPVILVVDDGSSDGTSDILSSIDGVNIVRHDINRGYGRALITAFQWAARRKLDWLITMDCDGQHEPCMIPSFVAEAADGRSDIVSGSRYLPTARRAGSPPPQRRAINYEITGMINDRLGLGITDAFCGFKAYRVSAIAELALDEDGYAMPMQLWARAARAGLRITEIPVSLIYNDPNRTFGGPLDNSDYRRNHYISVFENAMVDAPEVAVESCTCCCKTGGDSCCH